MDFPPCRACKKAPASEPHSSWSQTPKYCVDCKKKRIQRNTKKLDCLIPKVDPTWEELHKESMKRLHRRIEEGKLHG